MNDEEIVEIFDFLAVHGNDREVRILYDLQEFFETTGYLTVPQQNLLRSMEERIKTGIN